MSDEYIDHKIINRIDRKNNLSVTVGDKGEIWRFMIVKDTCFGIRRDKGPLYFRADNNDPRNSTFPGVYFYRVLEDDKMERIRVYNGMQGDIRISDSSSCYDWYIISEWHI